MLACLAVVLIFAGCGDSTETVTTTTETVPNKAADYINRGDALRGFHRVLNKATGSDLEYGTYPVSEGTCEYARLDNNMGWVLHSRSDSGALSKHRFTP